MNSKQLIDKITSGAFDNDFMFLYGETQNARKRYADAVCEFVKIYGERDNLRLFSAPGRTEIGGNHTDHQHGCVLAAAVHLDVIAVVSENSSDIVNIKSKGYEMDSVDLNNLSPENCKKDKSNALIMGVLWGFSQKGYKLSGFDAYTTSDVLKGSGLSSSAAFEVLVSNIVNGVYCGGEVDPVEIAKISQMAERDFFGKPCGLLDQMASSVGGFSYADFNDPQNPIIEKIDADFNKSGYTLCVVDTGGSHAGLTDDYADITKECKAVSNALDVDYLRDADKEKFYASLKELRDKCGDRAILRAFHFFNENDRANAQKKALLCGDFGEFFRLVNESGNSSYKYLQNLFSTSNANRQGLCLCLALTEEFLGGFGACRVHGGGFAGTVQCYVDNKKLPAYKQMIEAVFGDNSCIPIRIRPVGGYELKEK